MEQAAQHLRFFILTCHPEGYRGLSDTDFYDPEKTLRVVGCPCGGETVT